MTLGSFDFPWGGLEKSSRKRVLNILVLFLSRCLISDDPEGKHSPSAKHVTNIAYPLHMQVTIGGNVAANVAVAPSIPSGSSDIKH